ncbi:MAG: pirin family protein [Archangium sp.]|nr:pirin family protein [Archangium sp.]
MSSEKSEKKKLVLETVPLQFQWPTLDPFLFCVHHDDHYPAGNAELGPATSLAGRNIGNDFEGKDGWRMYHGDTVPGFPQHPHRGFETVTIVRRGLIDHSDSLGATARFGRGDTQWLTAGKGIVHCEMFPLLDAQSPNPVELFQIWLNLPAKNKMVEPHFSMLWADTIPSIERDGASVSVIAGNLGDTRAPKPPPSSWASVEGSDVAIWTLKLQPGAKFTLPRAATADSNRVLYFFGGQQLKVGDERIHRGTGAVLDPEQEAVLENVGEGEAEALLLQGKPIAEPVAQYGPFVMNSRAEIAQAFSDYQRTQFGGWPWKRDDPVHAREQGRFARHADGKIENR